MAAVLGGIGNMPGAMVGGLMLGLVEEFVAGYTVSTYRDAIAFGCSSWSCSSGPSGLFGRVTAEKV